MAMAFFTSSLPQFSSSTHTDDMPQSTLPDMSTQEYDPFWKEYLEKATSFDAKIIEDWNKIVDVTLVFVGLIIAVLASFIIDTSQQLKPDPADVTHQLLIAIYDQLAAQANNTSLTRVNTTDILTNLDKSDRNHALLCNALLYSSLGLCSVAAVLALAAKLWVTSYGHREVSSGETPHNRAMARQRAYSGILAWRMEAVIQSLPLILLIALITFGFFVHVSIWKIQQNIGYGVGALLTLSIIALEIVSLAAAFVHECPYNSTFSTIIKFIFRYTREALTWASCGKKWGRMAIVIPSWFASGSLIAYATIEYSGAFYLLIFIPIAITFDYATDDLGWNRKIRHAAQKYRLPHLTLCVFIFVASVLVAAGYFRNPQKPRIFVILYVFGMLSLLLYGLMASKMSKSLDETTQIDAITWLLKLETSRSSPNPDIFEELSRRFANLSDNYRYKPKILESLMPLLSRIISSPKTEPKDLQTYLSCLAYLAKFEDYKGSNWLLREDARYHPTLDNPLLDKLVKLADDQSPMGTDATNVLRFHGFDPHGKKLDTHVEKPRRLHKRQISGDAASMMTIVESAHSYEEMELHPRRKGGYHSVDV